MKITFPIARGFTTLTSITYTAVLDVRRETAEHLAKLLCEHRVRLATRRGTRAFGVFKQAVLVLRWFVDGTRIAQLARDNGISTPTGYRYLHEGLTVLADHAPDLSTALEGAVAVGYTHLNLDGSVIRTDRVAAPGPNRRIFGGLGNTSITAETCRSSPRRTADRYGWPQSAPAMNTTPPAPAPTASSTR